MQPRMRPMNSKRALHKYKYGSIHFPFALSAARSTVYRRVERKTLTANGTYAEFP